jgi:hypothetical protein
VSHNLGVWPNRNDVAAFMDATGGFAMGVCRGLG